MSKLSLSCSILLLPIEIYKAQAVLKHIRWITKNGRGYLISLAAARTAKLPASDRTVLNVLTSVGGDRLTKLGFKEYRARVVARDLMLSSRVGPVVLGAMIRAALQVYDFVVLGALGGAALIWLGATSTKRDPVAVASGLFSCIVLSIVVLLICAETVASHASMSSYGLAHHNPKAFIDGRRENAFLYEIGTLAGVAIAAVYVDAAILSFLSTTDLTTFGVVDASGPGNLFNCLYYSFQTFLLSTPLNPTATLGRMFILIGYSQGVFVAILALAALTSSTPITLDD